MFFPVKKHCFAVVLAVVFGVLMVLPFIYFEVKLGSDFHGIFPQIVNDEMFYYARIKDVLDGHPFLSNAYLFEHKDGLPPQLFLAEYLLAQPIKIFNLNINTAHLIYNFLLPAISFLLAYAALYLILRRRLWSLVFSSFLFFGLYPIVFIRPVSPQFNFMFWLLQSILLWRLLENQKSKKILFLNILNFGLLFYIYPYYWTYYLIFFGLLIAAYFFTDKKLALKIFSVTGGGLILAIPYFYLNYSASHLPYYAETLTRISMIYSRFPSGARMILWSVLGFAVFGWFLHKKIINWDVKTLFFISGILASIVAVNQHTLTGKNFEFSSHYDMGAMFFLVFASAYLVSQYNANLQIYANATNKIQYLKPILMIIILIVVGQGILDYSKRVFAITNEMAYYQNYAAIFNWLNKNTEKDSVVYANGLLSGLIPIYTANNVFYHRNANSFFISDDEVIDRFILNNFFSDFNKDFIIENVREIYGNRYIDAYGHIVQGNKLRRFLGMKLESEIYLPDEAMEKAIQRADELQNGDFIKEIGKYRVDYLVWDKNKNLDWKINPRYFQPVFENNGAVIYAINFD